MTSRSNQIDGQDMFLHNTSEADDHWSSFEEHFETTNEYTVLLNLHWIVPPALVSTNCIGSAFTLAK